MEFKNVNKIYVYKRLFHVGVHKQNIVCALYRYTNESAENEPAFGFSLVLTKCMAVVNQLGLNYLELNKKR